MGDEAFDFIKASLDVGDIIGVSGPLKRTEKGELSIIVEDVKLLTKSLLPLPDKFHGLKDVETRYRQRYVDMLTRPEARPRILRAFAIPSPHPAETPTSAVQVRDVFRSRSRIISTIRRSLEDKGFLEIETPVLQASAHSGQARICKSSHDRLRCRRSGSRSWGSLLHLGAKSPLPARAYALILQALPPHVTTDGGWRRRGKAIRNVP